jgi:hypothetical protein
MAFAAWRTICRANPNGTPPPTSAFDTEIPTPTITNFPGVSQYTLTNYKVYPLDSYWNVKVGLNATPAPIAGPNHGDLSYYYLASADVTIPTVNKYKDIVVRVRRVFQKETLSLWHYAVFFDDDLEINPGPAMIINGDVHTNGSLYTGHDTLTLNGKTTYTDDWSIGFMPGDNQHPETPTSPKWAAGSPPASAPAEQPYGVVLDDYHQLIEYNPTPPPVGTPPPTLDPNRFQTQAGVQIIIDASNNVKIYDASGTEITANDNGITDGSKMKNDLVAALTTNQTITDNREGATIGNGNVRLATLDVGAVTTAINNGDFRNVGGAIPGTFNGIIYITDKSATNGLKPDGSVNSSAVQRGIRLKNGAKLPNGSNGPAGLTIVSGNPIYVQGDYNTGTNGANAPPSNTAPYPFDPITPPSPTVAGYTRQPAAIVADAVNILSNSWVDSASGTMPAARGTTVNAGIISGSVLSGGGYYSGGVENFPRFLENWDGKNLTYYGAMIELYQSKQAIGHWGAGNVYSPPNRAWYFDNNFISNPPPGLLASYNYVRSRWYMQ